MNSTYFPHFTIGSDAYDKIPDICGEYGKTAVIIGGTKARIAAEPLIRKAVSGKIDITGSFLYGDDATFENAEALTKIPEIQEADMIFAVGGGRATDTCKWAAHLLKKPIFTFPTLASNCASVTAVCIMYNPDHSFKGSIYRERGAWHTFINTEIIAHSPRQYFWAGLGDALAKQYEVPFSARGMDLTWIQQTGVNNAQNVAPGILKYGKEALADVDKGIVTDALEAATLSIIVAPAWHPSASKTTSTPASRTPSTTATPAPRTKDSTSTAPSSTTACRSCSPWTARSKKETRSTTSPNPSTFRTA